MKIIKLTQGKEALIDDDDYERVNKFKWQFHKKGYATHGYKIKGKCKKIRMHRFILQAPKNKQVDHINGNTLDNRKQNLRLCSHRENSRNTAKTKNKTLSRYKGVSKTHRKYWRSYIVLNDKQIHLGYFKTEAEAAKAYNKKASDLFGSFARLNIIEDE